MMSQQPRVNHDLVIAHLGLAEKIAACWRGWLDDAEGVAALALVEAAGAYRPGSGSFARYAARCIRNALHTARIEDRLVRVPHTTLGRYSWTGADAKARARATCRAAKRWVPVEWADCPREDPATRLIDTREEVEAHLARLGPSDRRLVVAYYGLDGGPARTVPDLAAERGRAPHTISNRLHKARRQMAGLDPRTERGARP